MNNKFHQLSIVALACGVIYFIWLPFVVNGIPGIIFYILELLIFSLFVLFVFNHWTRRYQLIGGSYSLRTIVDIFIPTKNEPLSMLEQTISSAMEITYPNKRIYVIDDSNRPEIKQLVERFGCTYLVRSEKMRKTHAYKAATLNYALHNSFGNYILVLDADQIVRPVILDKLLGHLDDKNVAFVSSRQQFTIESHDFNHDNLFYEFMQAGKNADNAAISCGSGVIYKRAALEHIGGFQEWNIVEDFYTSYVLHEAGYDSIYVNQSFTSGEAPKDLKTIYKQRGTWARDTLRVFFWKFPLLNKKMTIRQRLHYFEMGYIYLVSALVIPMVYFTNFYSLLTNKPILTVGLLYLIFKIPSFYLILKIYNDLGQGSSSSRMWAALFPVYFTATIQAILFKKPTYVVTVKGIKPQRRFSLILPQLLFAVSGITSILIHIYIYGLSALLIINAFWLVIMFYWLYPVFPKAFLVEKNVMESLDLSLHSFTMPAASQGRGV